MANKIKSNDEVIITTGKHKGLVGRVLKVLGERVHVEGAMVKKHVKANPQANKEGGILEIPANIHISNVNIYNPVSKKADKVGFNVLKDGKKVRIFKSNKEQIDQ